ncbi:hypothetical protein [Erythrobacter mangrovi]|uniref:Uncharacterized protein n=1 Tax=Erythrobacter mangrovi TaxID=2739433 RepID=A0A7D3XJQ9_9SPHN|nr:hypothetical protein [Erythrobacter mangrovi]QKG72239.1 hypothetical protein HQR01_13165 [Erythrobacter mangrovi]
MTVLKSDIADIYRSSWAFMLACPLFFAIPMLVEFVQHVVELDAGMYIDRASASVAGQDPLRLQIGFLKTVAILLPGYWFARYIMFDRDIAKATRFEWPAVGLWFTIFALNVTLTAWSMFGPSLAELTGLEGEAAQIVSAIVGIPFQVIGIYLTAWGVAWALGNVRVGPIRSIGIMHGSFWYTIALTVAGIVPLMALHYGFGYAAIWWLPAPLDWLAMILDSALVGLLALTMAGSTAIAARHAAQRKGVSLLPSPTAEPVALAA